MSTKAPVKSSKRARAGGAPQFGNVYRVNESTGELVRLEMIDR
jgi:hypothetical protein